jgi:molybdopterin molybdotransferase
MGCCDQPGLLPFEEAKEKMLAQITSQLSYETIASSECDARVLAQSIQSPLNVPNNHNSAMDGYAFNATDLADTDTLVMVGKSFAGHPYNGTLNTGECIRIMTGAVLPECADTVEMQENCIANDAQIKFNHAETLVNKKGNNVRLAGEDIKMGDSLFEMGHKLKTADLAVLASLGIAEISVFSTIVVGVISTGDELQKPGDVLADGNIYESNSAAIIALVKRLGCDVIDYGIIEDQYDLIKQAFIEADSCCDVVISSGGVSVGEADYTKDVLDDIGNIGFWKLAIKPGKPYAFGKLKNSYFIGLPGNPVSALVTLHQLGTLAIKKLQGQTPQPNQTLKAISENTLKKRAGRTDFQRGEYFCNDQGLLCVRALGLQGSHVFSTMSRANCYIVIEQDRGNVEQGEQVTIELFDALLN